MPITRTPIVDDDGTGTTGTVLDNAWKQELYNQIDAAQPAPVPLGIWTAVPFNAANFTGVTVAAGQVVTNRYMLIGNTLFWTVVVDAATIPGTPAALTFTMPAGKIAAAAVRVPIVVNFFGKGFSAGRAESLVGQTYLQITDINYAALPAGACYVAVSIIVEVQ